VYPIYFTAWDKLCICIPPTNWTQHALFEVPRETIWLHRMQENHRPRCGSLQRSSYPLAGGEGLANPPQEPHPRSRPFKLRLSCSPTPRLVPMPLGLNLACCAPQCPHLVQAGDEAGIHLQDRCLHCALSLAAQYIVIGPVCLFVSLCVYYHDNSKFRASTFTKQGL